MDRRLSLGPDPLAAVTLGGISLVVAAVLLAASSLDGAGVGPVEVIAALTPLLAFVAYVAWASTQRPATAASMEDTAVAILLSDIDDPLQVPDDDLSRAAAEVLAAISQLEREAAAVRLAGVLAARRGVSPETSRRASPPSG